MNRILVVAVFLLSNPVINVQTICRCRESTQTCAPPFDPEHIGCSDATFLVLKGVACAGCCQTINQTLLTAELPNLNTIKALDRTYCCLLGFPYRMLLSDSCLSTTSTSATHPKTTTSTTPPKTTTSATPPKTTTSATPPTTATSNAPQTTSNPEATSTHAARTINQTWTTSKFVTPAPIVQPIGAGVGGGVAALLAIGVAAAIAIFLYMKKKKSVKLNPPAPPSVVELDRLDFDSTNETEMTIMDEDSPPSPVIYAINYNASSYTPRSVDIATK